MISVEQQKSGLNKAQADLIPVMKMKDANYSLY